VIGFFYVVILAVPASAQEFNLEDVTPGWLNCCVRDGWIKDDYVYLATVASGVQTYDISDPMNPVWVHNLPLSRELLSIYVDRNRMYASNRDGYCYIMDISTPDVPVLLAGFETPSNNLPDILLARDNLLFLNSCYSQVMVYDVTYPQSPILLDSDNDIECFTYRGIVGDTIYLLDHAQLCIVDASSPDGHIEYSVHTVPLIENSALEFDSEYIYSVRSDTGLTILQNDPEADFPVVSVTPLENSISGILARLNNTIYLYRSSGNDFCTVDISNPSAPVVSEVVRINPAYSSYAQSGNLVLGKTDEDNAGIIDLNTYPETQEVGNIKGLKSPTECVIDDGYLFVADMDFEIVRLDDNLDGEFVGSFITDRLSWNVTLFQDKFALVSCVGRGLEIYDVSDPESAVLQNEISLYGSAGESCAFYDYVFVDLGGGIAVVDFTNPYQPEVLRATVQPRLNFQSELHQLEGILYVPSGDKFNLVDIITPEEPVLYKSFDLACSTCFLYDDLIYTTTHDGSLVIINPDLYEPDAILVEEDLGITTRSIFVEGGFVYLVHGYLLEIYDARDRDDIHQVATIEVPPYPRDVIVDGNYAYVSCGYGGLRIIRLREGNSDS